MFKSWIRWDKHPNSERERERLKERWRERNWERESIEREGNRKVYG